MNYSMNSMKLPIIGLVAFVALVIFGASTFVLTEGKQAIITQFGRPIGAPITEAGLKFKKPFIQEVLYVDKRILTWDGYPNQIPTKDKKYIRVDTTARWKIVDALKFIQTVQNESGAKGRLDAILDSNTRDVISNHNLVEAVRNSNDILRKIQEKEKARKEANDSSIEEEITGEIEEILAGREKLSKLIVAKADPELARFGIKLIDVQLRRISYEQSVEKKVYERMISERRRISQKIRSIGLGEKAKIQGRLKRDLQRINSEAYRKAQILKGKAEAKSTAIYAKSLSRGPKFFEFIKSMEVYKSSLGEKSNYILSTSSDFLKYLKSHY